MKKYYPIMLDMEGKKCTVIGGGRVAQRKVMSLLEYHAMVKVISPEVTEKLLQLVEENKITLEKRQYQEGDLEDSYLVYVATDDFKVSEACYEEAKNKGIMINVVDVPHLCDFILPAVHRQGSLTLTVSTDGKSPMFSRKIREELETVYGRQYPMIIDTMGEIREKALKEISDIAVRKALFYKLTYENNIRDIKDIAAYQESMWKMYYRYRNNEGCDDIEKDKNWI